MKIALQIGAPKQEMLESFMQQTGSTTKLTDLPGDGTISAYDQDRLVGLGYILAGQSEPDMQVYVVPEYEWRGLRDNMMKLLLPMAGSAKGSADEAHPA